MAFPKDLIDIRESEWKSVTLSFLWFFFLMWSYNLLRPIRETFATELGTTITARLFIAVFITMLVAVPLFAWLVRKCSKRALVVTVFHFFASHLLIFGWLTRTSLNGQTLMMVFFVWVTVFILFAVSLLWSVLSDTFNSVQAKRLFGPIASGATIGSLVGSAFTGALAAKVGVSAQLLIACGLLETALLFAWLLQKSIHQLDKAAGQLPMQKDSQTPPQNVISDLLAGLIQIRKSRYLQVICVYIVLAQLFGTFVYFLLNETVKAEIVSAAARTEHFGKINFATQAGTLVVQTIVVSQVVKRFGVSVALLIWPLVCLACIGVVGVSPTLMAVSAVDVFNRVANYGMTVPAREMLFTVVSKDAKYKSKSFIDTVVVRGSDAIAGNLFYAIRPLVALGVICVGLVPLVIGAAIAGWWLGQKRKQLTENPEL